MGLKIVIFYFIKSKNPAKAGFPFKSLCVSFIYQDFEV